MVKNKQIVKAFHIPIYDYFVWVKFGGTQESFISLAKKKLNCSIDIPEKVFNGMVLTINEIADHCIWFKDVDPDANTIAHEVFHSVCHAMRHKGLWPLTKENEEAFAYLMGNFMGQIVLEIKKPIRKGEALNASQKAMP